MPALETNLGDLRHRVTLQAATRSADGMGGATRTWQDVATVWAKVQPVAGSEYGSGDQVRATTTYIIRLRYRADASPAWRVQWAGRTFNVRSVLDIEGRHQWTDLHCREGE